MDSIYSESHRDDPDNCLSRTLSQWLQQDNPTPTWRLVIDALKLPFVGYGYKADELAAKYGQPDETSCTQSMFIEVTQ